MHRAVAAVVILLLAFSLMQCSVGGNLKDALELKNNAEVTMDRFLGSMKTATFYEAGACFSSRVYEEKTTTDMLEYFESIQEKLGYLQSWQQVGWKAGSGTEDYCIVTYQTQYTEYEAVETFTLVPDGPNGEMTILNWNITSEALI